MKLSILVLPIILAQGYAENQILKRSFVGAADNLFGLAGNSLDNVFGGSFDNAVAGASDVAGSMGSDVAGDVGNVAHRPSNLLSTTGEQITHTQYLSEIDALLSAGQYSRAKSLLDDFDINEHVYRILLKLAVKKGDTQFLVSVLNFSPRSVLGDFFTQMDALLSAGHYSRAKSLLHHFDITNDLYNKLLKMAVRKGDDSFLIDAINSKPRSVLSDLKLMKYVRQISEPERANQLSSAIANNIGETVGIGNTGINTYYDLVRHTQKPYDKALLLSKKFYSEARSPAEKKVWGEITQYIQTYSVRISPPENYFNKLEMAFDKNDKNAAKMLLTNIHQFPIEDYFDYLDYAIYNGDKDLIMQLFSKGKVRRSAIADAEFMKLAKVHHTGTKGEELSRLIGMEIPAEKRKEAMEYAYSEFMKARYANNIDEAQLWEVTAQEIFELSS